MEGKLEAFMLRILATDCEIAINRVFLFMSRGPDFKILPASTRPRPGLEPRTASEAEDEAKD